MEAKNNKTPHDFFLPDFCQAQSLFLVVLVTELLAVLFTAFDWSSQASFWSILAIYSVSIQMVTLFSIASLCLLRNWLSNFDDWMAGLLSLSIILFFTLLFSLMVIVFYWILPIDLTDSFQLNFIFRNILVSSLIGAATLRYFYLQLQYRKQLTLQTSAKLDALQARIRPHFLFNSMNVIASLTQIDADKAESAIEDLSDLFRVTLDNAQEMIPFQQELDNAKKYLSLEQLRLGERLVINESIDKQSLSVLIPPLSLQPLLENAVYHGIQPLPEGGEVDLKAIIENGKLLVSVSNPKSTQKDHHGAGIALSNISERLDMLYKGKASLQVEETDKQYQVTMKVPVTV